MKIFLAVLIMMTLSELHAQDIRVRLHNGTIESIPLDSITLITVSNQSASVGGNKVTGVLKTFALLQNYPNPFNPTTTIQYELTKPSHVVVRIFDLSGKSVRTLTKDYSDAGMEQIVWNGRNDGGTLVASGAYIYQVEVNGLVLSKKMLLIK
jgi:flagellar hook assembly protein FlgD